MGTLGTTGMTTGVVPAMTLGSGGIGGSITGDNITVEHMLNVKRLAYEIAPVVSAAERPAVSTAGLTGRAQAASAAQTPPTVLLPAAPPRPAPSGISGEAVSRQVDAFLSARGFRGEGYEGREPSKGTGSRPPEAPLDFVCEEDVRIAIRDGRTLVISERAIVTPAARELADQHRVLTVAPWRG
jgi:acetaldehyde dehydrogenase (acetylating)